MSRREDQQPEKITTEADRSAAEHLVQLQEQLRDTQQRIKKERIEHARSLEGRYNASVVGVAGHPTPIGAKEYALFKRINLEDSYFVITARDEETNEYTIKDIDPLNPPQGWKVQSLSEYLGEVQA